MDKDHIEDLLDQRVQNLSEEDSRWIESHIAGCPDCEVKYRSAVIANRLLGARVEENIEPSAFFTARVMARVRERPLDQPYSIGAFWRMGRALFASMLSVIAILLVLTFYGVRNTSSADQAASDDIYTTEWAILNDGDPGDDVSDSQVLTTLYEPAEPNGQDN